MASQYDVTCIGNAIVDVLSSVEESFISAHELNKGSMTLIDEDRAEYLYGHANTPQETSGGSAANTAAGIARLGQKAAYIGKVRDDVLGQSFAKDIRNAGVTFDTAMASGGTPTARSFIFVTPDAERTMNTFLGACAELTPDDVDENLVANSAVTYLEGYLWDRPQAKDAFRKAIEVSSAAGKQTSITLSDAFCVDRFRGEFADLIKNGVDIVFANEDELLSLYETKDFDEAVKAFQAQGKIAAVTRGAKGSVVIEKNNVSEVATDQVANLVDTTGAGDLFAAGFLASLSAGSSPVEAAAIGNREAGLIIQQVGARLG